jgi:hypothetical protein
MALVLKTVRAGQGSRWIGDALRLFARRPLAFTALALVPGTIATLLPKLPLPLAVLAIFSMPLLSLGFMVAAQSALLDGPVRLQQFIEPLRGGAPRRNALLRLCAGYLALVMLAALLAASVSGDAFQQLQSLNRQGPDVNAKVEALMPDLTRGLGVMLLLYAVISVPYWHAPALVHWGGQSAQQALFSSTLALWRTRGAVVMFLFSWIGLMFGFVMLTAVFGGALASQGGSGLMGLIAVLLTSALCAVFYISALFCFNDTFGGAVAPPAEEPPAPPAT